MHKILPADLVPLDIFKNEPVKIDVVYADANHPRNIFGEALYRADARMWCHKDLAKITLLVARILNKQNGWTLDLKDCLRTVEGQTTMGDTKIVKANPQWCEDGPNRMVSPPGHGAHPRAMAIDVCILDKESIPVDMGTEFDEMIPEAARDYEGLSDEVKQNRAHLDHTFKIAGDAVAMPILPIPSEWWDFRFFPEHYKNYEPIKDSDLPPQMQMTGQVDSGIENFDEAHFQKLGKEITDLLDKHHENLRAA